MTRCYCERIIVVSLLFFLSVVQNDQTVENNMCSGAEITYEATNAIQKLTTPNYNFGFLPNNSTCSIIIRAPENSSVWIKIEQLSMEPQLFDQCSDFIKIINTSSKTPQKEDTLAVLCGAVNNRQFVSTTNVLRLDILSDMLIESKGAEISYRALENKKCEDGWHEFKMKCFFLSEENKELSWVEAQRACVEQQSNLASISQYTVYEETLNWLTEVNASKTLWIGMHDAVQEGVFVSMSGNHDFPFNWGSPNSLHNSDVKDCLYLDSPLHNRTDGDMFRLDDCRKKRAFLCEKSKDGKTWTAPDQEDIVRNGAQSWSLDLAFWLLFALILLLIALMCIACGYAITQKQRQARVSALEGQGNQAPANTMSTTPSDQRAVRHQPERSDTIQETVTEVQDLIEVHSNDHKIKTEEILDKNMRNVESEKHPLEIKSTGNDSFPLHQESPNQIIYIRGKEIAGNYQAGTNSRERTSNTFNTRDESFLKSKKAAELFGRPKMNVLDNVSAISLDEFWSNKPM